MSPPTLPAGSKDLPSVTEILAAANMRRLLEAYRSLAPLTIGGPSSTSLETPGTPLSSRPTADPRLLRKFAHYPWLMGPVMPPAMAGQPQTLMTKSEDGRRRHASCDSLLGSRGRGPRGRLSPSAPVFTPKDKESSRCRPCVTIFLLQFMHHLIRRLCRAAIWCSCRLHQVLLHCSPKKMKPKRRV